VRYEMVDTVIRSQARLTYTRGEHPRAIHAPSMAGTQPSERCWSAWII
jgi:hypothetical protein